jgi:hypothetical protein
MILQISKKEAFVHTSEGKIEPLKEENGTAPMKKKAQRKGQGLPKHLKWHREWSVPFRIFPSKGKYGSGYTILWPTHYRTKYGFYDVMADNVPEDVALFLLQAIQLMKENPDRYTWENQRFLGLRALFMSAGADVWGRRDSTWWWKLASDESIIRGNGGWDDGLSARVPKETFDACPFLK